MIIRKGMSDITTYFKLVDPSTGVPETGLVVSDLDLTYVRDRGTAVKADMLELAAANSTHSDIKGYEVDGTNCPGLLRVDWPDAAFADGANRVQLCINGANIDPAYIEVELVDVDFGNATDMGLATLSDLIADTGTDIPATLTVMTGTLSDIVADTGTDIPTAINNVIADTGVLSDIDANMDTVIGKLPSNYIMGSGDQTDHNDELSDILADTGTTIPATLVTMSAGISDILADTGTTIPATLSDIYAGVSDILFDAQIMSDIDTNVDVIVGKLPSNFIMGSSDQADHDAEISDILADTGTTIPATLVTMTASLSDIVADTGTDIPATLSDIFAGVSDILFDAQIMSDIDTNVDSLLLSVAVISDIDANVDAIFVDTGTTIPATLSDIQANVSDILFDAQIMSDIDVNVDTIVGKLPSNYIMGSSNQDDYNDNISDILGDTKEIGAAGAGLTNINLPNQTMDIIGDITGSLSGSVASVSGAVGSVAGNVDGNVTGSVGSVAGAVGSVTGAVGSVTGAVGSVGAGGIAAASFAAGAINAAAIAANAIDADALADDAITEIWGKAMTDLAQGAPSSTASVLVAINYLYEAWRNKTTTTATLMTVFKDDGTTGLVKSTIGDDGTTFTKGELISGA